VPPKKRQEVDVKLSLNLPALERLLGGDTEIEVELRNQIVAQFMKRHLPEVVKSETYCKTMTELRAVLEQAVRAEVGQLSSGGWAVTNDGYGIKSSIKQVIEAEAYKAVNAAVEKAVDDRIHYYEKQWAPLIAKKVEECFTRNIDELVKAEVARRLDQAAKAAPAYGG
jgi:hypothetical protein